MVGDGGAVDVPTPTQTLPVTVAVHVIVAGPWPYPSSGGESLGGVTKICQSQIRSVRGLTRGCAVLVKLSFLGFGNPKQQLPFIKQYMPHMVCL